MKKTMLVGLFVTAAFMSMKAVGADYVINVSKNTTVTNDVISTTDRVVLTGDGTLVLKDGNTFGDEFVVSNGYLVADYEASGLAATHLTLVGKGNNSPAIFRPKGTTFTSPVASSGIGKISFLKYAGLSPYDHDLTVNLGGDERVLKHKTDGFSTTEFMLGISEEHDLIFKNGVDLNGNTFTLKNPWSTKPTYFEGIITNSHTGTDGKSSGNFIYWDGTTVFRGKPGRVDIYYKKSSQWEPRCGTLIYSNCTIRTHNDFVGGNDKVDSTLTCIYGGGCDHYADNAWDKFSGRPGSKMIVDGGTYDHKLILFLGQNNATARDYKLEGNLVITNNGTVKLGTFALHRGSVEQYSGLFSVPNDDNHSDGSEVRIGGWRAENTPIIGAGLSTYNLYSGTFDVSSRVWMHIGSAETGIFNQFGGTASVHHPLLVGYCPTGVGTLNVHGGTFSLTRTGDIQSVRVGFDGTGTVSVANGGLLRGAGKYGVQLGSNATGNGTLNLDLLGELETTRVFSGSGANAVMFNGGTMRASTADYLNEFINVSGPVTVSPFGGAIDTNGKGNISLGKAFTSSNGTLVHRWSFAGGSLVDSVGGWNAEIIGNVTTSDGCALLSGGNRGSSQIKLGTGLVGTSAAGWTYEMWFMQKSEQRYARLIQCSDVTGANNSIFVAANNGGKNWYYYFGGKQSAVGKIRLQNNVPYHLSFTMFPMASGWKSIAALRNPETGDLYDEIVMDSVEDWSPTKIDASRPCWIGNSAWEDNDPNIEVYEVRTHNRALTRGECAASAKYGMRGPFYFSKKGVGTLTMTGANDYAAGTSADGGTLKLAAGATLPANALRVAAGAVFDLSAQGVEQPANRLAGSGTVNGGNINVAGAVYPGDADEIGTLTLAGTELAADKLVVDVSADGACDLIAGTGTIDVSNMIIKVANPDDMNPEKTYRIINGPAVSGKPAGVELPRRWVATVSDNGMRLVYGGATSIFIR